MIKRQSQKLLRRHSLVDRTGKYVREVLAARRAQLGAHQPPVTPVCIHAQPPVIVSRHQCAALVREIELTDDHLAYIQLTEHLSDGGDVGIREYDGQRRAALETFCRSRDAL